MRHLSRLAALLILGAALPAHSEFSPVDMANEAGFKNCVNAVRAASEVSLGTARHGTHSSWFKSDADARLYSSLTVKGYSDGDSQVIINAARTKAGDCDVMYSETFTTPASCAVAREKIFSAFKFVGTFGKSTIQLTNKVGLLDVFLTGTQSGGCLVTRKESKYD